MNNPIDIMKAVVEKAELGQKLGSLLDRIRSASESDVDTLNRLLQERSELVRLLHADPLGRDDHASFDFEYRHNLVHALQKHLFKTPPEKKG